MPRNTRPDGNQWIQVFDIALVEARFACRARGRWCEQLPLDIASEAFVQLLRDRRIDFGRRGWKSYVKTTVRHIANDFLTNGRLVELAGDGLRSLPTRSDTPGPATLHLPAPGAVTDEQREQALRWWQERMHRAHFPLDPASDDAHDAAIGAAEKLYLLSDQKIQEVVFQRLNGNSFKQIAANVEITEDNAAKIMSRFHLRIKELLGLR